MPTKNPAAPIRGAYASELTQTAVNRVPYGSTTPKFDGNEDGANDVESHYAKIMLKILPYAGLHLL